MTIVKEELDETLFWLEFTIGLSENLRSLVTLLWKEGNELMSIVVSSIKTAREKLSKQ